jgi:hypothetical protein
MDMNITELKNAIYEKLNGQLDIPLVDEQQELRLIRLAASTVVDKLPIKLLPLLYDVTDGISQSEYDRHRTTIVSFLNDAIDIPYVPEGMEANLMGHVLDAVMSPLLKD